MSSRWRENSLSGFLNLIRQNWPFRSNYIVLLQPSYVYANNLCINLQRIYLGDEPGRWLVNGIYNPYYGIPLSAAYIHNLGQINFGQPPKKHLPLSTCLEALDTHSLSTCCIFPPRVLPSSLDESIIFAPIARY
ncbi:hypothetical protein [Candidatus Synchoanobacter obligatus]|uniref:Uncharacterized protein n=1 Tax=Candidatus Synchoanobacter obligatus TaxID=2919597 RepID=A0ABT1L5Z6_9GAMM|nr:hypothetical protein [Candidatus Synchoanobacter obligatus]MCP8352610.1 hypothetical protein [Candidatus Synchoanobacter obligatus]